MVCERRPDLGAVDDPLVAVEIGTGDRAGQIRAAGGLREELDPVIVTAKETREVFLLLLLRSEFEQRRRVHAQNQDPLLQRHLVPRDAVVEGAQVAGREALPAILLRGGGP